MFKAMGHNQCFGSILFLYGTGSSDPFCGITEIQIFSVTFFSIKNIFLKKNTCFVIFKVHIYAH